jgi:hypothetical protein
VTGQDSTNLVFTILGFHTIIVIGFHHHCWWSSYQDKYGKGLLIESGNAFDEQGDEEEQQTFDDYGDV